MNLVTTLAAHRQHLLSAFKGPAWQSVAVQYGAPTGDRRSQLESALAALVAWAQELTDDADVLTRLDDFTQEALDQASPRTTATAGLGMIFANATANTGWWAAQYCDDITYITYVASCGSCGAPQTRVLHFQCEHCGEPLYPERT